MSFLKVKVFTYSAGWGHIVSSQSKLEDSINDFIVENGLNKKEIISMTQSESDGKLFTLTFLYKD